MSLLKQITKIELEEHNQDGDIWVVLNGKVYDLSKFYQNHPGGSEIIRQNAGKDCTTTFEDAQHDAGSRKQLEEYVIGEYVKPRVFLKLEEISDHNLANDLWLLIAGKVYNVSTFKHPGMYSLSLKLENNI